MYIGMSHLPLLKASWQISSIIGNENCPLGIYTSSEVSYITFRSVTDKRKRLLIIDLIRGNKKVM